MLKSTLARLLATALVATHAAAVVADDAGGSWVQLIPSGSFNGRDGRGPFVAGDRAAMQTIVENTRRLAGSTDLVVDYDHQSVFAAVPGVGGTARAAGWIKQLEVRDSGIYGRVEWTEAAAAAIKAGEYRYLSPVFLHAKNDGRVLVIRMAGLTNTPNLDLAEVAASALVKLNNPTGDSMDKILAALGLALGSGEDAVLSAINALLTNSTVIAKALGLKDGAKPDEIMAAVNSAVTDRAKFAQAAGLKTDAKSDDIVQAVQSAVAAGNPDPTKFVPIAQVTALQADLKTLKDGIVGDKAEEAVNSAIKGGKLAPALKDWGLDLFKKDQSAFQTFVGSAPILTNSQLTTPKRDLNAPAPLDELQAEAIAIMGIDPEAYRKTLAAEAKQEAR